VRAEKTWVQSDTCDPLGHQSRILPCGYASFAIATTGEEEFARALARGLDIGINRLAGLLRQLKPDRMSGFLLTNGRTIDRKTVWSNILDLETDNITSSELAIDGEIEHREIARSALYLQLGPDRPNMLGPQRRFGAHQLSLIPRGVDRAGMGN
jgi:hypothetical protein